VPLEGERLTLGRGAESSVAFPSDDAMSRSHAVLERSPDGWVLRDTGSSNGTWVNGTRLVDARRLQSGDELLLGESRLVFFADEKDPAEPADDAEARTTAYAVPPASAPLASAPPAPAPPPAPVSAPSPADGYLDIAEEWGPQRPSTPAPKRDEVRAPSERTSDDVPVAPSPGPVGNRVRGVARSVQIRKRDQDRDVLTFRVDRYDASGNRIPSVAVELMDFEGGHVAEGEEVEVTGRWSRGTLRASRVVNLSTRSEVRGKGPWRMIAMVVGLVLILCFFAFIIISILTQPTVENPFE
jgi:pSer/pThr/pTyr-binding forkhead associated (FHA) protein